MDHPADDGGAFDTCAMELGESMSMIFFARRCLKRFAILACTVVIALSGAAAAAAAPQSKDPVPGAVAAEAKKLQTRGSQLSVWVNGYQYRPGGMIRAVSFTSQTWAACGASSDQNKLVRTFTAGHPPLVIKPAYLRCGTTSWGYRHISERHSRDWAALGGLVGADWRSFADFAISTSLSNAYKVVYQFNNTTMYQGIVQIKNSKGTVMATYYPVIVRANQDGKIITAFPTRTK